MLFSSSDLIYVIPAIFISMSIHEAMHAFVAYWLGDTTAKDLGRLTINPLKHVDIYTTILLPVVMILLGLPPIFAAKPVPIDSHRLKYDEFGTAIVGVAGPLTNLVLAGLAALLLRHATFPTDIFNFLAIFTAVNVSFFIFNMIPFPPLDGSRLLYAFAPEPLQKVMLRIEGLGFSAILIFFFIFLSFFANFVSGLSVHLLSFLLGPLY